MLRLKARPNEGWVIDEGRRGTGWLKESSNVRWMVLGGRLSTSGLYLALK